MTATTTDLDLLRAVCAHPAEDTPRLALADWLEERGEGDRAEFVRVQCELARTPEPEIKTVGMLPAGHVANQPDGYCSACRVTAPERCDFHRLRRRERELLDNYGWQRWQGACAAVIPKGAHIPSCITFCRGFVSHVTLAAADWLAHHEALYWHPQQTVECECVGWTRDSREERGAGVSHCKACHGSGRVPRPFPATACPLERVTLTTVPPIGLVPRSPNRTGGWDFTVEWLRQPDGTHRNPKWPGIVFDLPRMSLELEAVSAGPVTPPPGDA